MIERCDTPPGSCRRFWRSSFSLPRRPQRSRNYEANVQGLFVLPHAAGIQPQRANRGQPEPGALGIPGVVSRMDPTLPVEVPTTLARQVRENMFLDLFVSVLSVMFACLATLLAAVGLYGVLACTVVQLTREIGLRVALGATPIRVRAMILRQVAVMVVIGSTIGLGVAASWADSPNRCSIK